MNIPEWWNDDRYIELKNAHCDMICDLILNHNGKGVMGSAKLQRIVELVQKGYMYEGLEK